MQSRNKSLALLTSGIATIIGSFVWMNAAGFGGIALAPLFYIVGPGLFVAGAYQEFINHRQGEGKRNIIIVLLLILAVIAGIIIVNVRINAQQEHQRNCEATYTYLSDSYKQCINE
jgi:uncharacterized membrane protein